MIRRLRWKITGVTMLVAFMVLLAVFGGVYFFSQANIAQSYIHQLKQAVQTGVVDGRFLARKASRNSFLPVGKDQVAAMPWNVGKRHRLAQPRGHLAQVRPRRLRFYGLDALALIIAQFHVLPPIHMCDRGTLWDCMSHAQTVGIKGFAATVGLWDIKTQNFYVFRVCCIYSFNIHRHSTHSPL